jgi:hypothetical protein
MLNLLFPPGQGLKDGDNDGALYKDVASMFQFLTDRTLTLIPVLSTRERGEECIRRIDGQRPIYSDEPVTICGVVSIARLAPGNADNHFYAGKLVIFGVDRPSGEDLCGWPHRVCGYEDARLVAGFG